jgi:hypothetical protein
MPAGDLLAGKAVWVIRNKSDHRRRICRMETADFWETSHDITIMDMIRISPLKSRVHESVLFRKKKAIM